MMAMQYWKEVWRGKDIYRILMNTECLHYEISGVTIDVGSGLTKASYHRFLRRAPNTQITPLDLGFAKNAGGQALDLETDPLPYAAESVDSVLLFNLLEHVFHYTNVVRETHRVLKPGGTLVGAVPFLVNYHPDPHDFWRYTTETLAQIFRAAGFSDIHIMPFGRGPFTAGWSHVESVIPRFLKLLLLPIVLLLDRAVVRMRPALGKEKFPLGYFFSIKK